MINDPLDCSDVICTPIVTNTLLPILEMLLSELHDTQFTKVKSASWFNLPFIASLFEIFLMYFNIIEWQVRH